MVTQRRPPIPKKRPPRRIKLYTREWRKFMGVSAVDCAAALDIERISYLRLEREPWRITVAEQDIIAKTIGVTVSQLRFPPPEAGKEAPVSIDAWMQDAPENVRAIVIAAVKGMLGK